MAITEQKGMMTPPEKEEEETTETSEFEIPKGAKKVTCKDRFVFSCYIW